ncbi:MAG: type II secretion system protein [Chloroflexi bacterium]|nr:type II secretion system protein [Chloroflexota bacterium]
MKSQRGMALVELLVAIAITGLIIGLPGTAIYQFFAVTESGSRTLTALHDVQNAASWFALDGQMATSANVSSGLELTLSDNSTIEYELEGSGPLYELRRSAGGSEIVLARNVADAVFTLDGRVITMTITSSPVNRWGVTETRTYKVYLRPTSY